MIIGTFIEYKGYKGTIEYDDKKHHGKLIGINGLVNYTANSLEELFEEYKKAIDDYNRFLDELGVRNEEPNDIESLINRIFENLHLVNKNHVSHKLTRQEIVDYIKILSHIRHTSGSAIYGTCYNKDVLDIRIKNITNYNKLEKDLRRLNSIMMERDIEYINK